jgi:hypothetical protein
MTFNINDMTPEQRAERLVVLKRRLKVRQGTNGKVLPGFEQNVKMLEDEIDELESRA